MKFNLTIDKKAEAVIDGRICVNCGKCAEICPTEAIDEYRRAVYCMFPDCRTEAAEYADAAAAGNSDANGADGAEHDGVNAAANGDENGTVAAEGRTAEAESRVSGPETGTDNRTAGRDNRTADSDNQAVGPETEEGKTYESCAFSEARQSALEISCTAACPLGIVPQTVAALVHRRDFSGAYNYIAEKNPLPHTTAVLCEQVCGKSCIRGCRIDEAPDIRALERYAISRSDRKPIRHKRRFDEKIAVIGSGPAGLAAAFRLSQQGYGVTIFEKDSRPGGSLYWAVPDFRLKRTELEDEISGIFSAGSAAGAQPAVRTGAGGILSTAAAGNRTNIEIRYHYNIGKERFFEEVMNEGFSACIIAAGAAEGVIPQLPGADAEMVFDGAAFMRGINTEPGGIALGQNIAVEGSGRLAADICRLLRRMGKTVTCIFAEDEGRTQMPAEDIEAMKEEGVRFAPETRIRQIIAEDGRVKAAELVRTGTAADENGTPVIYDVKGSEINLFCDAVVFAGKMQSAAGGICSAETYPDGRVKIDAGYRTSKPWVFACGDAAGRGGTLPQALASGISAANAVGRMMHGISLPGGSGMVWSAPDAAAIYSEDIQQINRQSERILRNGTEGAAGSRDFSEDVLYHVRAAGIEEEMPAFMPYDEAGNPKAKIAVIGGGMAGITAAIDLAKAGYMPTIFEKEPGLGGSLRWLASDKRIDKELLEYELEKIEKAGISVICSANAGVAPDIRTLAAAGYKSVLFTIGETRGVKPALKNADCRGVFDVLSLMGRLVGHEKVHDVGEQVIVTGSDELTFDAARLLKESGAQVTVMAPCSRERLKAGAASVSAALDEGVNLVTGVTATALKAVNGRLRAVNCRILEKKVDIGIACDTIVFGETGRPDTYAIGRRNKKLDIDENGYIQTNDRLITSMFGVFAAGDFGTSAQEAGHAGAEAVRCFMERREFPRVPGAGSDAASAGHNTAGIVNGAAAFDSAANADGTYSGMNERGAVKYEIFEGRREADRGFECGHSVLEPRRAAVEASRCLGCGYRQADPLRCMGCGVCTTVCPSGAVTMVSLEPMPERQVMQSAPAGYEHAEHSYTRAESDRASEGNSERAPGRAAKQHAERDAAADSVPAETDPVPENLTLQSVPAEASDAETGLNSGIPENDFEVNSGISETGAEANSENGETAETADTADTSDISRTDEAAGANEINRTAEAADSNEMTEAAGSREEADI